MRLFFIAFVFALGATGGAIQLDREARATIEITRYVEDWARNLPRSYRRALVHIPSVAHWSVAYDVDPLLVAVVVSMESSWKLSATGTRGEVGLMQVHAPEAKKGFDLTDPDEQVHAGVRWLRICIETCGGNVVDGLNNYATGRCRPHWFKLDYRVKRWKRAVRLFRVATDSKSIKGDMDSKDSSIPATAPPNRLELPPL